MNKTLSWAIAAVVLLATPGAFARSLEEIRRSGEIIVGMRKDRDAPPMNYLGNKRQRTGIDIELGQEIARRLGVRYTQKELGKSDDRENCLKDHCADIVVDSFTVTPERRKTIDFSSKPYLVTGIGLLLNNRFRASVAGFEDIGEGTQYPRLKIAVEGEKSTMYAAFKENYPGFELKPYPSGKAALAAFERGEVDGFTQDEIVLKSIKDKGYLLDGTITQDFYGIGVSKDDNELRDKVSEIIDELSANKFLEKITETHTQRIEPPKPENPPAKEDKKPSPKPGSFQEYTVQENETLSRIAHAQCGHYTRWRKIYEVNREVISYPDLIKSGQVLKIPKSCQGGSNRAKARHREAERKIQELKAICKRQKLDKQMCDRRAEAILKDHGL